MIRGHHGDHRLRAETSGDHRTAVSDRDRSAASGGFDDEISRRYQSPQRAPKRFALFGGDQDKNTIFRD